MVSSLMTTLFKTSTNPTEQQTTQITQKTTYLISVQNEEFSSMGISEISDLLKNVDYDISGCLIKCSNKGTCARNKENKFECRCFQDFNGPACQTSKKQCSVGKSV